MNYSYFKSLKNFLLASKSLPLIKLIIYYTAFAHIQPTLAVQFDFTEMTTDENFTYNGDGLDYNSVTNIGSEKIQPAGLNNVTQFKVQWNNGGSTQTDIYNIGSGANQYDFVGLEINATNTTNVIQYVDANQVNSGTNFLFSNPNNYISAGTRGLSLSTGLNKVGTSDTETITFPVLTLDTNAVADDVVDLIVADIAENQSYDSWELLDSNGNTVASLAPQPYSFNNTPLQNNDWHRLGSQHLERVKVSNGNLETTGSSFTDNAKSVYGLALELSDFVLSSDGVSPLDATTAASVKSMKISVPAAGQTASKTDYAFFATNQDSITFDPGISNEVPFEFSPGLGLLLSGGGLLGVHCLKKKKQAIKSNVVE